MPAMQPQRRSGPSFWERFGPGGTVQRSAGEFAAQLGENQFRGLDPRTWNDPVTPQYDAQGRPVSAGVMMPLGPGNQMVNQLQDLIKLAPRSARTNPFERKPLTRRMRRTTRGYGIVPPRPLPSTAEQLALERKQMLDDYAEDYARELPKIDPATLGPMPPSGLKKSVSWDDGKRPRPPRGEKDEQLLAKLKERLNPKQGSQVTQKKIFDDDEFDFGPNWWEQGGNPFDKPYHAQPGASPLETDHPKLFRPIANHPLEQEEWIKHAGVRHDTRLPDSGRVDANAELNRYGRRNYDTQRLKRVRDEIDREKDFVNPQPIPVNPHATDERYYRGAELNVVPKRAPAHPLAKLATRIAAGRRGGV